MLETLFVDLTDLRLWLIVLAVSAFGVADKLVYFYAGQRGGKNALNKIHGYTPERAEKLHNLYDRRGSLLLLLASVPIIGSAMTVLGGVGGVGRNVFIVLVSISNLVRNWLIVILAGGIAGLFQ
jgi:membrane protein DedA with SNARE-associated domain